MAGLLLLAFLVVPVVEIYVIVQVGQQIGALPTVVLLLVESALGAWIVRREGSRAWQALRGAVGDGKLPSRELADAALVLIGGTLLLTPGFVTDIVGFLLVLPFTRPVARRLLAGLIARRSVVRMQRFGATGTFPGFPGPGAGGAPGRGTPGPGGPVMRGDVVQGEVVRDDVVRDEPPGSRRRDRHRKGSADDGAPGRDPEA